MPIAYTELHRERVKIYRCALGPVTSAVPGTLIAADREAITVACGDGTSLRLLQLQLPGGKALSSAELLNGRGDLFQPGQRFDDA
jgi:methionyl-tRNA formyltransferase